MRVSELNQLVSPQPISPGHRHDGDAPRRRRAGGSTTDFSSMLQGAMTSGNPTTTATAGTGAVGAPVGKHRRRRRMVNIARGGELGVTESPSGSNNSPRIAQYRSATGGQPGPPARGAPYFVSWGRQAGPAPRSATTAPAMAPSTRSAPWGQRSGRAMANTETPKPGDPDSLQPAHRSRRVGRSETARSTRSRATPPIA